VEKWKSVWEWGAEEACVLVWKAPSRAAEVNVAVGRKKARVNTAADPRCSPARRSSDILSHKLQAAPLEAARPQTCKP